MISNDLKFKIRDLIRTLGLDVRPNDINSRSDLRLVHYLKIHHITTVLDVGANTGQFARKLLRAGYDRSIVSFEALPHVHDELKAASQRYGSQRWTVAPRCALGDQGGLVEFHVTNNLQSSSMLKPSEQMRSLSPTLEPREILTVECRRLDEVWDAGSSAACDTFLKIDAQGAEPFIINSATKVMPRIKGLLLEMPVLPLYEGQMRGRDLDRLVTDLGFELWDQYPGFRDGSTGRLFECDAVYFRA